MCGMEFEWFNFAETPQTLGRQARRGPGADHARHVRLFAAARERGAALFRGALQRAGRLRRFRSRACTPKPDPACTRRRSCSAKRSSRPTAPCCSSPRRRRSARASASCRASWPSGAQQYPGCSGHIHQSLSDGKTNRFYDPKGRARHEQALRELSRRTGRGMMQFAPMFWPTINSYKRLVDGFWAPVKPTWGVDNRTASFRVIPGSPKSTRLETRCPGADVNPYLAMAAVHRGGAARRREESEAHRHADHRHQPGVGKHPARAAHADRDHAHLRAVGYRARLARRRVRRSLRRHPRVGMAAVARRVTDWELKRYFEII